MLGEKQLMHNATVLKFSISAIYVHEKYSMAKVTERLQQWKMNYGVMQIKQFVKVWGEKIMVTVSNVSIIYRDTELRNLLRISKSYKIRTQSQILATIVLGLNKLYYPQASETLIL